MPVMSLSGGVLQQKESNGWRPLSFFSKKLDSAQQKYSAFDRELLAAHLAVRHFRFQLQGRPFTIFTDHKPLTQALHRVSEPWSPRQQRQLSAIAEHMSDLRHVPGNENVVADALSRPNNQDSVVQADNCDITDTAKSHAEMLSVINPIADGSKTIGLDLRIFKTEQEICNETMQLAKSPTLNVQTMHVHGVALLCDLSTKTVRPLVPFSLREKVFRAIHNVAHGGRRPTQRMVAAHFVWRGMNRDIAAWCRDCQGCARGKVTRHTRAALVPIPVPSRRFSHVHMSTWTLSDRCLPQGVKRIFLPLWTGQQDGSRQRSWRTCPR